MDTFQAYYADVRDPAQQPCIAARLRDQGLVTFSNLADRAALAALARRLRLHGRDRYSGIRIMLRILGDPLPDTNVAPGFPSPSLAPDTQASRAA